MHNMNKNKGVSTLAGIDTLYYFIDIKCDNYSEMWLKIKEGIYKENFEFIGYSGKTRGFVGAWFKYIEDGLTLFRIGFKDPTKQKNIKNVYVQFEATGIYFKGFTELLLLVDELLSSDFDIDGYHVSRADLNMFVNYDFGSVDWKNFRSRSAVKKSTYTDKQDISKHGYVYYTKRLETLYLGSRNSPIHFKIYDKGLELVKKANPNNQDAVNKYIVMLEYFKKNNMDYSGNLWNIEFSLKRKGLLEYGIDTIRDLLDKAGNVFCDLMQRYVFLDADEHTLDKYRQSNSLNKIPVAPIWEYFRDSYMLYNSKPAYRTVKERKRANKAYRISMIQDILESSFKADIDISLSELFEAYRHIVKIYRYTYAQTRSYSQSGSFGHFHSP